MKKLFFVLAMLIGTVLFAQASDKVIVNNLLDKNFNTLLPTLDSLGVYYHLHKINSSANGRNEVNVTIANSATIGKLYTIKTTPEGVLWIQINYVHGILQHVKCLDSLKGYYTKHVGKYSTDVKYYSPLYYKIHFTTDWLDNVKSAKDYLKIFPYRAASVFRNETGKFLVGIISHKDDTTLYFIDGQSFPSKDLKPIKY